MSEIEGLFSKIRNYSKTSRRGKLNLERMLSMRTFGVLFLIFMASVIFLIIVIISINYISSIDDENLQLSTIIALFLLTQLLITFFQFAFQQYQNRIASIAYLPHLRIEIKKGKIRNSKIKDIEDDGVILFIVNKGTDACNVSYDIRDRKKLLKHDDSLSTISGYKEIFAIPRDIFFRKELRIKVNFEDLSGFFRYAEFRKDKNIMEFRTRFTGL